MPLEVAYRGVMADPGVDGVSGAEPRTGGPQRPASRGRLALVVGPLVVAVVIVAVGLAVVQARLQPDSTSGPSSPAASSSSAALASSASPASSHLATTSTTAAIVAVDRSGSASIVQPNGHATALAADTRVAFGFPAWSPDGTRIAVVAERDAQTAISILDARPDAVGASTKPTVVYRSADIVPFYLSWAPDGHNVSFLATESSTDSLRIAPADGSAPLDGSGPGAMLRRGAPLYYDWIGSDRLVLHVGTGPDAFLGEVGLDGSSAAPALAMPGDFRPAVVSRDQRYVAYARVADTGESSLVVAARDGSGEHLVPVFGTAALLFDPTADRVASIGPDRPDVPNPGFLLGPLRLVDAASGATRTLLDGTVVAFFWSPDGKTIAALRLEPAGGGSTAAIEPFAAVQARIGGTVVADAAVGGGRSVAAASPSPAPSRAPAFEVHLIFVDVATAGIRSQRVVRLGGRFIDELLPYFDQYALSHRLWAPDGSSFLLPVVGGTGATQLVAFPVAGGDPTLSIDAEIGFWSP